MLKAEHTLERVMLPSPHFSCLCFKLGQVILQHTMSSPQFLFPSPQVSFASPLVSRVRSVRSALRINVDPCHSPPKRFNRFNACGRWLDILQVYSRHRAHLYSTRELYSTHVPRGEEEEAEEKDTAETSHRCCHKAPPLEIQTGARCHTALWAMLRACARAHQVATSPCRPRKCGNK